MTPTNAIRRQTAVAITAWPRLHFGLLDLGHVTSRRYGGAGCSIEGPATSVSARAAETWVVERDAAVDGRTEEEVQALLGRMGGQGYPSAQVTIRRSCPQHVGLGSKTTLLLAIAEAVARLGRGEAHRGELQRVSRRGGTSGAGINLYFDGGFVVDGGHPDERGTPFGPSSSGTPTSAPPVLARHPIPEHWRFHLMRNAPVGPSGHHEADLFASTTPLPRTEVLESIAAVHHELLPGFALGNLSSVKRGLDLMQSVGFKRREVDSQPRQVRALLEALTEVDTCAAGMSSVGPLVFAITDTEVAASEVIRLAGQFDAEVVPNIQPVNDGRTCRNES